MTDHAPRTVWMLNHYAAIPSKDGWTGRHQALSERLGEHGWNSVILAASTGHPIGRQQLPGPRAQRRGVDEGVLHVIVKASPYSGNGIPRMLNMATYAAQVLLPGALRGLPAPDVIVGSTVHPLAAWAASRLARRYRVPFVFEIRDVWPEALIDLGQLRAGSAVARSITRLMHRVAGRAHLVLSPLPGIGRYLDEIGLDVPYLWVPNGVDAGQHPSDAPRQPGPFTFMYMGSHGNANGIDVILRAFDALATRRPESGVRMRLVGSGPKKAELQALAASMPSADAIRFDDRIPRANVPAMAREADALVAYLHDHGVYRYGVSPNKLFDYLLSARPVVFATTAMNNPIVDAGAGIAVASGEVDALSSALERMLDTPADVRDGWGQAGRRHVLTEYSYTELAGRLAGGLDALVAPRLAARTQTGPST